MKTILTIASLLMGVVGLLYLHEVYGGIKKHSPPCAPITMGTVVIVYTFAILGISLGGFGSISARKRIRLLPVNFTGCLLNIIVFALWVYWNINGTLLPYSDFCKKVGMG